MDFSVSIHSPVLPVPHISEMTEMKGECNLRESGGIKYRTRRRVVLERISALLSRRHPAGWQAGADPSHGSGSLLASQESHRGHLQLKRVVRVAQSQSSEQGFYMYLLLQSWPPAKPLFRCFTATSACSVQTSVHFSQSCRYPAHQVTAGQG